MKLRYKTGGAKGVAKTSLLTCAGALGTVLLLEIVACSVLGAHNGC